MSKWTRLLAVLLCVCLLFTSCAPVGNEKKEYSQEVQNLEKLCKVWGYVKYTHPVFLTGEKDWDAELITLIPQELICKGLFLPPNTYDCGSFVVN